MDVSPNNQLFNETDILSFPCKYCQFLLYPGYYNERHYSNCYNCSKYVCTECFYKGYIMYVTYQVYLHCYKIEEYYTDIYDAGFNMLDEVYYVCSELCQIDFEDNFLSRSSSNESE